jgi:hypothetical protein
LMMDGVGASKMSTNSFGEVVGHRTEGRRVAQIIKFIPYCSSTMAKKKIVFNGFKFFII